MTMSGIAPSEAGGFTKLNYLQAASLFSQIILGVYWLNTAWLHFNWIRGWTMYKFGGAKSFAFEEKLFIINKSFAVHGPRTLIPLFVTPVPTIWPQLFVFLASMSPSLSSCFLGERFQQEFSPLRVCLSWQGDRIPLNWGNQQTRMDHGGSSLETLCRTEGRGGSGDARNSSTPIRTGPVIASLRVHLCVHPLLSQEVTTHSMAWQKGTRAI